MARPRFIPTPEQRQLVAILVACGMPHDTIVTNPSLINPSTQKPITAKTLRSAFRKDIDQALEVANARVAQSLFQRAVAGKGAGAVTAAIFWLKTKAGWKESAMDINLTKSERKVAELPADLSELTDEQLVELERELTERASAKGGVKDKG